MLPLKSAKINVDRYDELTVLFATVNVLYGVVKTKVAASELVDRLLLNLKVVTIDINDFLTKMLVRKLVL